MRDKIPIVVAVLIVLAVIIIYNLFSNKLLQLEEEYRKACNSHLQLLVVTQDWLSSLAGTDKNTFDLLTIQFRDKIVTIFEPCLVDRIVKLSQELWNGMSYLKNLDTNFKHSQGDYISGPQWHSIRASVRLMSVEIANQSQGDIAMIETGFLRWLDVNETILFNDHNKVDNEKIIGEDREHISSIIKGMFS